MRVSDGLRALPLLALPFLALAPTLPAAAGPTLEVEILGVGVDARAARSLEELARDQGGIYGSFPTRTDDPALRARLAEGVAPGSVRVTGLRESRPDRGALAPARPSTRPPNPSTPGVTADACGRSLSVPLFRKWKESGGRYGRLGCPVTGEQAAPPSPRGTRGTQVAFEGAAGALLVHHATGPHRGEVHAIHGCIYRLYRDLGGTGSWLGFPVGDDYRTAGGRRTDFEGGAIAWEMGSPECRAYRLDGR